jgi:hypothetical protein
MLLALSVQVQAQRPEVPTLGHSSSKGGFYEEDCPYPFTYRLRGPLPSKPRIPSIRAKPSGSLWPPLRKGFTTSGLVFWPGRNISLAKFGALPQSLFLEYLEGTAQSSFYSLGLSLSIDKKYSEYTRSINNIWPASTGRTYLK